MKEGKSKSFLEEGEIIVRVCGLYLQKQDERLQAGEDCQESGGGQCNRKGRRKEGQMLRQGAPLQDGKWKACLGHICQDAFRQGEKISGWE